MPQNKLPRIYLNKAADRRLRNGHCWIYSNEIDNSRQPLKVLEQGAEATVVAADGRELGSAYFNPAALLCGRLYSRSSDVNFTDTFSEKIKAALAWREHVFSEPFYRLIYGDGDGLPGVVIDRFGDLLSLQVTTAGAMAQLEFLIAQLIDVVQPRGILLRNDAASEGEGLTASTEVIYGEVPETAVLIENGLEFEFPIYEGQKTGWFFDHRESRKQLKTFVRDAKVLDLFCYLGGWGLQAAQAGAQSVHCVDRSALALEYLQRNAKRQGVDDRVSVSQEAVDQWLKGAIAAGEKYDVVVLDPPAFIKRRKDQRRGEQAYHRINQQAVKLLSNNGILVSASCSLHLTREQQNNIVRLAANKQQLRADIIYRGGLGADHPSVAAIPEMDYLKTLFARVSG